MPEQSNRDLTYALSVREAVEYSGLSRPTLYRLMADGKLPSVKLLRRRLILVDDIKAFLRSHGSERRA